jgi:hypothetical protein
MMRNLLDIILKVKKEVSAEVLRLSVRIRGR